ncbi:MAG: MoxR family ATPase [Methanoregulaceae archaeon]|nr:MoxR family ATPase [Methanoregulaceae archaeon]
MISPTRTMAHGDIEALTLQAQDYSELLARLRQELETVIVGQGTIMDRLLVALCAEGHVLLEGVPGIAKTLLVRTLAQCLDCSFARLQFTPDLLPADITGTKIFNQQDSTFSTVRGPIFAHIVLADEINRAPPKVQSALLEAMQERQVTIQGETHCLERPFFVLATQNPIESEGTYPLPEAQVDRFMFKVLMTYPEPEDEIRIIERFTGVEGTGPGTILNAAKILELQDFNRRIYADPEITRYVAAITDATRHPDRYGLDLSGYISYGASPRASIYLVLGAKAVALMKGRGYVVPDDVKSIAHEVLRHRILRTFEAEAEGITPDQIITGILQKVAVP